MPGICGYVALEGRSAGMRGVPLGRMLDAMGDEGRPWIVESEAAGFGERLRRRGPSRAGAASLLGSAAVVLDGNVLNTRELGLGDSEPRQAIAALYARHGAAFVERIRGEFALALCDSATGTCVLARDRQGA